MSDATLIIGVFIYLLVGAFTSIFLLVLAYGDTQRHSNFEEATFLLERANIFTIFGSIIWPVYILVVLSAPFKQRGDDA